MQDRVSTYPGRVTLTPVSGEENTYTMTRADEPIQVGTPLNTATLLSSDAVAAVNTATGSTPETPSAAFQAIANALGSGIKELPDIVMDEADGWEEDDAYPANEYGYKLLQLNSSKFLLTAGDEGHFSFIQDHFTQAGLYYVAHFAYVVGNPLGLSSAHTLSAFPSTNEDIRKWLSCRSYLQSVSGTNYVHYYNTCYVSGKNRTYFFFVNSKGAVNANLYGCQPFYIDTTL